LDDKIYILIDIILKYPKLIDYLYNRVDTCFGEHIVYLIKIKSGDNEMLKVGYSKNSVIERFQDKRFIAADSLEITEIIRSNTLQAKGAVDFENKIMELCKEYIIESHLILPGKTEFMDVKYLDEIVKIYDSEYDNYKDIVGLKSPN
jgi:hypothetical protein